MSPFRTLLVASRNRHKCAEIEVLLGAMGLRVISAAEAGYDREIEETKTTFAGNAALKATTVARALGLPALADDSGLEVDALGGEPGVRSARYAGDGAGDEANNERLLERLAGLPASERGARFRCALALADPDGRILVSVEGSHEGTILAEGRGTGGFGYDPLFYSPELQQTFAEAGFEAKGRVSHRARALAALVARLATDSTWAPFAERLTSLVEWVGTPILLGLDPHPELLPSPFRGRGAPGIRDWGMALLEVARGRVAAIKLQMAHYERHGGPGLDACIETANRARELGLLVIADGKRGDIGATARAYSAHLDWADAMTIHPYLGTDSIRPFLERCGEEGRGIFVLVRTSNPSAGELQDIRTETGQPFYEHVAGLVDRWGKDLVGPSGWSAVGAVAGATAPEALARIRKLLPHSILLVPGYGAQGGEARDVTPAFDDRGQGALIAASRSLTFGDPAADPHGGWEDRMAEALERMRHDLQANLRARCTR